MALEQDSVHSFLFISASNAALHRHFIFDFAELQKIFKILNTDVRFPELAAAKHEITQKW